MKDPKFWVALVTLVISAVIAIINLRAVVSSIRGQTYQRIYAQMIDLDRFFFEHQSVSLTSIQIRASRSVLQRIRRSSPPSPKWWPISSTASIISKTPCLP